MAAVGAGGPTTAAPTLLATIHSRALLLRPSKIARATLKKLQSLCEDYFVVMEKEHQPDSMATITMKPEYPPSEVYSASEPPPV